MSLAISVTNEFGVGCFESVCKFYLERILGSKFDVIYIVYIISLQCYCLLLYLRFARNNCTQIRFVGYSYTFAYYCIN